MCPKHQMFNFIDCFYFDIISIQIIDGNLGFNVKFLSQAHVLEYLSLSWWWNLCSMSSLWEKQSTGGYTHFWYNQLLVHTM